ncbi:APCL protein, partial [Atractosteus spatula]|nr:APCL protein [Atractosteus spatula]
MRAGSKMRAVGTHRAEPALPETGPHWTSTLLALSGSEAEPGSATGDPAPAAKIAGILSRAGLEGSGPGGQQHAKLQPKRLAHSGSSVPFPTAGEGKGCTGLGAGVQSEGCPTLTPPHPQARPAWRENHSDTKPIRRQGTEGRDFFMLGHQWRRGEGRDTVPQCTWLLLAAPQGSPVPGRWVTEAPPWLWSTCSAGGVCHITITTAQRPPARLIHHQRRRPQRGAEARGNADHKTCTAAGSGGSDSLPGGLGVRWLVLPAERGAQGGAAFRAHPRCHRRHGSVHTERGESPDRKPDSPPLSVPMRERSNTGGSELEPGLSHAGKTQTIKARAAVPIPKNLGRESKPCLEGQRLGSQFIFMSHCNSSPGSASVWSSLPGVKRQLWLGLFVNRTGHPLADLVWATVDAAGRPADAGNQGPRKPEDKSELFLKLSENGWMRWSPATLKSEPLNILKPFGSLQLSTPNIRHIARGLQRQMQSPHLQQKSLLMFHVRTTTSPPPLPPYSACHHAALKGHMSHSLALSRVRSGHVLGSTPHRNTLPGPHTSPFPRCSRQNGTSEELPPPSTEASDSLGLSHLWILQGGRVPEKHTPIPRAEDGQTHVSHCQGCDGWALPRPEQHAVPGRKRTFQRVIFVTLQADEPKSEEMRRAAARSGEHAADPFQTAQSRRNFESLLYFFPRTTSASRPSPPTQMVDATGSQPLLLIPGLSERRQAQGYRQRAAQHPCATEGADSILQTFMGLHWLHALLQSALFGNEGLDSVRMAGSVASYDQLVRQVEALRKENTHLRRELEDNSNHLSKLENETSDMKEVLKQLQCKLEQEARTLASTGRTDVLDQLKELHMDLTNYYELKSPLHAASRQAPPVLGEGAALHPGPPHILEGALQKTGTSGEGRVTAQHLEELCKERTLLLSEIEKEERERRWYYSQLQGLSQRLAELPRVETFSMQMDLIRQQLEFEAQQLRSVMEERFGTSDEMVQRTQIRVARLEQLEKELQEVQETQEKAPQPEAQCCHTPPQEEAGKCWPWLTLEPAACSAWGDSGRPLSPRARAAACCRVAMQKEL